MGFIMEKENSFKDAATHYEAAWRYSNKVMELQQGNTIKVVLLAFYFQTMDRSTGKGDIAKY